MFILHAGFLDSQLTIWGETSAVPARRARKAKGPRAPLSPFDPGSERLAEALSLALPQQEREDLAPETLTLWLPTVAGQPLASHPLIAAPPETDTPPELAPWSVTAVPLSAAAAIDLLTACAGQTMLQPGVLVGQTLAFWSAVLRFAAGLVARQQFLPGIEEEQGRARWEPILSGPDAQRLAQFAKAMPAACRALGGTLETPPDTPATMLLSAFLAEVVDRLVRSAQEPAVVAVAPGRKARKLTPAFDSVHDAWAHALRSEGGELRAEPGQVRQLAEQVQEWRRPISVSTATPFRLCFRLDEPPPEDEEVVAEEIRTGTWHVHYLLQAADDPSLLVPVADAWEPRGRKAALFRKGSFQPREYLLSALGQAASLCPAVEESLKSAAPGGFDLDATGAFRFLSEHAFLLEQAGFGVYLPAWWTRKGTKLRLSVRAHVRSPAMQGGNRLTLDELLHVDWQIVLGETVLSPRELELLARLKAPLVKVRGQWVQLTAEEIQQALDFWKRKEAGQATARDVVQLALGAGKAPIALPFAGVEASGWIDDLLGQLEGRAAFGEVPVPAGFQGVLRPYQVRGYSWLAFLRRWGLGACLADDMGLGKTVQTLAFVQRDWKADGGRPALLICPMSVVGNWEKEAARFTPELPILVHHGLKRPRGPAFRKEAAGRALVLTSYGLLHRDYAILKEVPWAGVILDEAQNIKNPETKQAQAARSLPAGYHIALTGTPVENHVGDLWSIMEFLNPGLLGGQAQFRRSFFYPIQVYREEEASRRLHCLTGPFVLRRLKTDKSVIADLPEKLEMKVFCSLTREQASLYAAVVDEASKALDKTEGIQRKGVVLGTLSKLKQVCNHPAQFLGDNSAIPGRSGKLARLAEMLEEVLAVDERALVFTQFTEMGALIQRHLQETFGVEVLFLHGGVNKKQRDALVARFQAPGAGPPIFVLSLKAGGTGLNLTAANHVFHFDRWWNPAVENQATDRAFRIGQTRGVQVHKFLCAGTLEDKIDAMIEGKQEIAGKVVGSGEGWLTELSTAQLKDLFALRQEAFGE
jgi:SNF2 family DNA or RNA helicase